MSRTERAVTGPSKADMRLAPRRSPAMSPALAYVGFSLAFSQAVVYLPREDGWESEDSKVSVDRNRSQGEVTLVRG